MLLNKNYLKKIILNENSSIQEAINNLNISGKRVILINNNKGNFVGIVNDGDIRRAIGRGLNIKTKIKNILNKNPFIAKSLSDLEKKFSEKFLKSLDYIPIVANKKILGLYFNNIENNNVTKHNETILIMGGGFGKRLGRLTKNCPKALLIFDNKPLLQHLIEHIKKSGFYNVLISVFFLKNKIKKFIKTKKFFSININFLEEKKPLGTIGSLKLIRKISNNFIVINCDTISDINYYEILKFHKQSKALLTIGVKNFQYKNPYGIIKTKNNRFISFSEKPELDFNINAGIYVFNKKIIPIVKNFNLKNIEELIKILKKKKIRILTYPIYENWFDYGQDPSSLRVYKN